MRIEQGEVGLVPSLYQGQYLDTETGIAYNRFRYYSPETGAYISQDSIRLEAGLTNLYAYVLDVNAWVDPWGLKGIIPTILLGSNNEILEATATINKMDLGGGSATNRSSRSYARSLGNIDDDAGHIIGDHCASTPLHNLHFPLRNSGVFRLRSGMLVSPPCPLSGRMILPRGGFSGLFGALEHKKPRHTLQIVCHSFQDILCMRSLKPSVATSPS